MALRDVINRGINRGKGEKLGSLPILELMLMMSCRSEAWIYTDTQKVQLQSCFFLRLHSHPVRRSIKRSSTSMTSDKKTSSYQHVYCQRNSAMRKLGSGQGQPQTGLYLCHHQMLPTSLPLVVSSAVSLESLSWRAKPQQNLASSMHIPERLLARLTCQDETSFAAGGAPRLQSSQQPHVPVLVVVVLVEDVCVTVVVVIVVLELVIVAFRRACKVQGSDVQSRVLCDSLIHGFGQCAEQSKLSSGRRWWKTLNLCSSTWFATQLRM